MIKQITTNQKDEFNNLAVHPLQTWEWGEFRKESGNGVVRFAKFKDKKITASYQLLIHKIPGVPYKIGTLIRGPKPTKELLNFLKSLAKDQKLIFIKLEPNILKDEKLTNFLKQNKLVKGKTLFTPTSFWIDLVPDEDKLLSSFSSKTRYNIRLATRKGVEVIEDNSDKAFEKYLQLTKETVERQGFYAHSAKYHQLMWKHLNKNMVAHNKNPTARLLVAKYKGEIITTWILFAWKDFLFYPYGASSTRHRNVMANNLMMWEAIRLGKKLNLKTFDLWGREKGKGFTKFKEGYNPKVVTFLGTWDLPTSSLYIPYRTSEALRWGFLRVQNKLKKPKF